jgi:hypothetical protein
MAILWNKDHNRQDKGTSLSDWDAELVFIAKRTTTPFQQFHGENNIFFDDKVKHALYAKQHL